MRVTNALTSSHTLQLLVDPGELVALEIELAEGRLRILATLGFKIVAILGVDGLVSGLRLHLEALVGLDLVDREVLLVAYERWTDYLATESVVFILCQALAKHHG